MAKVLLLLAIIAMLSGCGEPGSVAILGTLTATPSPTATATPSPTPSATSTATPTPTPTPTPTATPTPTPTPTATPVPPTPTPRPPTATPTPTDTPEPTPAFDFIIPHERLLSNEENGGISLDGSAANCGMGHSVYITVLDKEGQPLNGIVVGDTYNNVEEVTGSRGLGRCEFLLWGNTMSFTVKRHINGQVFSSEETYPFSSRDELIPIAALIGAHYCATYDECVHRINSNGLCRGHYSYEAIFLATGR
jgi:hypothetical protein